MTTPKYMIAHGGAAVQAARIIAAVAKERPADAEQRSGEWNYDMSSAPKDAPILGLCKHDADPYHDETTGRLTDYGCSAEGLGRVQDGPHVLIWGGGDSEYDEWAGKMINWPDWWFRFGSEFEEAANPIAWMPIPKKA